MRAYVFGTFYTAAGTLSQYLLARQAYYQRYAAEGFEPNDMALTLALSIPFSYCLAVRTKGVRAWIYRLQLAVTFLTVLLSASRTGFLACCLASAVAPLTFHYLSRSQRGLLAALFATAVIGGLALIPASSWKRLSTIGAEVKSGSLNSRSMIWKAGLATFREHPIAGVGVAAYPRSVEPLLGYPRSWRIVAHNSFFSVLVETGMVGFALFAVFLGFLAAAIWHMPGFERAVWSVTMLVWTVGVSTLTWEMRKPTWLLFALVLAVARALRQPVFQASAPPRRAGPYPIFREVVVP
jgi:O-antigen ligase